VAELREDGVAEPHAARHVHGRVRLLGGLRGFPDVHLARAAYGTRVTTPRRQGRHRAAARQMSGRRTGQVPGIPVAQESYLRWAAAGAAASRHALLDVTRTPWPAGLWIGLGQAIPQPRRAGVRRGCLFRRHRPRSGAD
jgi:hypothetical protein